MPLSTFSTEHTRDTDNPQTYWQHARVAISNSFKLMLYGLYGIVHGVLPEIPELQFKTSSFLIKTFKMLVLSCRHDPEIERILGPEFLTFINNEYNRDEKIGKTFGADKLAHIRTNREKRHQQEVKRQNQKPWITGLEL